MAYMMSGEQWLNERGGAWLPYLMFFVPNVANADLGGSRFGDPWPSSSAPTTGCWDRSPMR